MSARLVTILEGAGRSVTIGGGPVVIIGERINPTGRRFLARALGEGNLEPLLREARAQVEAGAAVLDVNVGVPGLDQVEWLPRVVEAVQAVVDVPLCLDSPEPEALAAGLRVYRGKALLNSTTADPALLDRLVPLAREHGAALVGLLTDEGGIPGTADGRLQLADRIVRRAEREGLPPSDLVLDPVVLAVAADTGAAAVTLATIAGIAATYGVNITLGASNVSFGLPGRAELNAAFLALAIGQGVTCPIADPTHPAVRRAVLAAGLLLGRDPYARRWIGDHRRRPGGPA
ncbi:MAG: dihydropteroate synthase [bacterium]|nr:dihydropteroate synthase [bacterium]